MNFIFRCSVRDEGLVAQLQFGQGSRWPSSHEVLSLVTVSTFTQFVSLSLIHSRLPSRGEYLRMQSPVLVGSYLLPVPNSPPIPPDKNYKNKPVCTGMPKSTPAYYLEGVVRQ